MTLKLGHYKISLQWELFFVMSLGQTGMIHLHTTPLVVECIARLMPEKILFKFIAKMLFLDLVRILMKLDGKTSLRSVWFPQ